MSYEKDIPEYAMMPAKEAGAIETSPVSYSEAPKKQKKRNLEPVTKGVLTIPTHVTNVTCPEKVTITVEEDILVPDVKPDLAEILMINGNCHLSTHEILHTASVDEYTNLSGEIALQILYKPVESQECSVIPIESKMFFKEQWLAKADSTTTLDCCIDKIDYMVVNERKLRVNVSLFLMATEYCDKEISLFEGLVDEHVEKLHETVEFSSMAMRTKDPFAISEEILPNDDYVIDEILCQHINVLENYKQATSEKVVINGFVCLNLLYSVKSSTDDSSRKQFHQLQEKIEFTQFVAIQTGQNISHCNIFFDSNQLKVRIAQNDDGRTIFKLDGTLITYIELFRNKEKEIVVDAYHKEKNFVCDFEQATSQCLVGSATGEATLREIFSPNTSHEIEQILYTCCRVSDCNSRIEQNKIITEGTITANMLCLSNSEEAEVFSIQQDLPFRVSCAIAGLLGDEQLNQKVFLKDSWAEKINGKQVEFNCTVVSLVDAMKNKQFSILTNPAFDLDVEEDGGCPMIIYSCKEGDSIWHIAKKFKTTTSAIMNINNMESENLKKSQRLLIIK